MTSPAPPDAPPEDLVELHRSANRAHAGAWGASRAHRARVTALVAGARHALESRTNARLCVLGAGNCNDLELVQLADLYDEIHLVDLDHEAVERALARQDERTRRRLFPHAPLDLTGALSTVRRWAHATPAPSAVASLAEQGVARALPALPGPFDVVISTCLLGRMTPSTITALGPRHQAARAVASALELGHLRAISGLLADGGIGLVIVDAASSDTYPVEALFDDRDPETTMRRLEATGLQLPGSAPSLLQQIFRDDPSLAARDELVRLAPPWLWTVSAEDTSLCYAIVFRARACS